MPYGSPYTLPIPATQEATAVTTAPNVSYPDTASTGLVALANPTFALRFSGRGLHEAIVQQDTCQCELPTAELAQPVKGHSSPTAGRRRPIPSPAQLSMFHSRAGSRAGSIQISGSTAQNYTFMLVSDDSSLLSIDGHLVVSDPGTTASFQ